MTWKKDSRRAAVTIKEDSILTGVPPSLCAWCFKPWQGRGERSECQRFLSECVFILSVTVGPNLISVGWVCRAVRLFSYRHTLGCACEVPKGDRLVVTAAPYLEIAQMNCVLHHFIRLFICDQTTFQWWDTVPGILNSYCTTSYNKHLKLSPKHLLQRIKGSLHRALR